VENAKRKLVLSLQAYRKCRANKDKDGNRVIRTLDELIGNVKDISERDTVIEEHLKIIMENLILNVKDIQKRGRGKAT
jgi:hypothetical protein